MGTADGTGKNKIVAGVLAILLGSLGIHHFYLGSTTAGIILLVSTVLTCGFGVAITGVLALIEDVLLLVMPDPDFDAKYNDRTPEDLEFVFQNPHKTA